MESNGLEDLRKLMLKFLPTTISFEAIRLLELLVERAKDEGRLEAILEMKKRFEEEAMNGTPV